MKTSVELLPGAWAFELPQFEDQRGAFIKTYAASHLAALGLPLEVREQFFTRSHRNVIRGLHFQRPPHDHVKLVCCLAGRVQDVLVDLRTGLGYGRVAAIELSADRPQLLYLPAGIAHGFRAREDGTVMMYVTSSEHVPTHDAGILWNSIAHDWCCEQPIVSGRDSQFPPFANFESPFGQGG